MNHRNLSQTMARVLEHGGVETPVRLHTAAEHSRDAPGPAEVHHYRSLGIETMGMVNDQRLEMAMENDRRVV